MCKLILTDNCYIVAAEVHDYRLMMTDIITEMCVEWCLALMMDYTAGDPGHHCILTMLRNGSCYVLISVVIQSNLPYVSFSYFLLLQAL